MSLGFGLSSTRPSVKWRAPEVLRWSCWSVVGVILLEPCLFSSSLYRSSTSPLWAATFMLYVSLLFTSYMCCFSSRHHWWFNSLKHFISQKVFEVPSTREQQRIPFARVNHAKYMVTDRVVYIGMFTVSSRHVQISQHDLTCMLFHIPATWRQVWRRIIKNLPTETVTVYIYNRIAVNMSFGIKWMSVL